MSNVRTPLLDRQGLPVPIGSNTVQDHPIFLRVCHSPWPWLSQSTLVYIRATIVAYLTTLIGMLLDYEINWREKDGDYSPWRILFQFSSLTFALLWLYHVIVLCWSFTHLYYPDIDEDDDGWESRLLSKMSPPKQTINSRKRFYFSVFYTVTHVFVFINVIYFWTVLVPNGHGHLPKGEEGDEGFVSAFGAIDDFFTGEGWFPPFCVLNLWVNTAVLGIFEILVLNSVKRQVPVASHVFLIIIFLGWYLGWAAFGLILTEYAPFFWMNREAMERTEVVAAYAVGFVLMGPAVFSLMYGLIGMRENLTSGGKDSAPVQTQPQAQAQPQNQDQNDGNQFVQFAQDVAHQVQDSFQRATGQEQR